MNDTTDELSPDAKALLARASGGDDPAPGDRARVRAALMATVAGGAGLAASTAASTAAASSATATATGAATISLTAKIACAVILVSAVGGTVAIAPWEPAEPATALESRAEAPRAPARAIPSARPLAVDPPAVEPALEPAPPSEPALAPPIEPAPVAIEERNEGTEGRHLLPFAGVGTQSRSGATGVFADAVPTGEVARPARPVRSAARPVVEPATLEPAPAVPVEPAAATPSSLAEEVRLLAGAQRALNDGDPITALARLAEHGRRFPSGTMAEERDAARALALCRAGRRQEAQAAAARFLAERPTSPLAARVRASCE